MEKTLERFRRKSVSHCRSSAVVSTLKESSCVGTCDGGMCPPSNSIALPTKPIVLENDGVHLIAHSVDGASTAIEVLFDLI